MARQILIFCDSVFYLVRVLPVYLCQLLLWSRNKIWHLCCWELDGCVRLFSFIVCVVDAICLFIYIIRTTAICLIFMFPFPSIECGRKTKTIARAQCTLVATPMNSKSMTTTLILELFIRKKATFPCPSAISHQPSHNTSTWSKQH